MASPNPHICQVHIQVQKNWGDDNTNLEVGRGRRAGREQRNQALKVRQLSLCTVGYNYQSLNIEH